LIESDLEKAHNEYEISKREIRVYSNGLVKTENILEALYYHAGYQGYLGL